MNLQTFKDNLAKELYRFCCWIIGFENSYTKSVNKSLDGETIEEAHEAGLCIQCKQLALPNCYSEAGKREYRISGLCEKCFDEITK